MTVVSRMTEHTIEELLSPISAQNPVGDSVRYEPVFDDIKNARREDDPQLSQGIWQTPYKVADWAYVEKLCCENLMHKSKDLQLSGWLTEAWTALDGFPGLARGLTFMTRLAELYWPTMYPDVHDVEYRQQILEWFDAAITQRIILIPLTNNVIDAKGYHLADWMSAKRFDAILRRSPDKAKLSAKAVQDNQVTMKDFTRQLMLSEFSFLEEKKEQLERITADLEVFKNTLNTLEKGSAPSFKELGARLQEMVRLIKGAYEDKRKSEQPLGDEQNPELKVGDVNHLGTQQTTENAGSNLSGQAVMQDPAKAKKEAYAMLENIAKTLEKVEPQGAIHHFLQRLISWENKTLLEVFQEFGETPQDLMLLIKLLRKPGG